MIYRTQLFNPDDMENVKKIQAGYKVQPLSAFLGKPAPPAAPAINWPKFEQAAFTTGFAEYLNFLLQFCPPTGTAAVEIPLREKFAKLGIGVAHKAEPKTVSPEIKAAIGDGVKAAFAKIGQTAESVGTTVNGWNIGAAAGSREFYHGNWALRAAAAKLGIYGNSEAEAVYPFTRSDVNSIPLDGSKHTYLMTFPAGQLPPVNAFWSITMYDGRTQLLIENPINRYLINSPMLPQLKKNPDGSLTRLYPEGFTRQGPGVQLASRAGRPDVRRHAPLLAEDRAALGLPAWQGDVGASRRRAGTQPERAGREALRRQVAGEFHPHRRPLRPRRFVPGAAGLGILELPRVPQADPESEPMA